MRPPTSRTATRTPRWPATSRRTRRALDSLRAVTAATRYRTDQLRRAAQDAAADLHAQKARAGQGQGEAPATREADAAAAAAAAGQGAPDRRPTGARRRHSCVVTQAARAQAGQEDRGPGQGRPAPGGRATRAVGRAAAAGNGQFAWPTSGTVTQEFGCTGFYLEPPRGTCAHFHDGIDIANAPARPIRAAGAGVVAFVGWNPYDGSRPSYVRGHRSRGRLLDVLLAPASRGAWSGPARGCDEGQLIGYMGNTGNSTGRPSPLRDLPGRHARQSARVHLSRPGGSPVVSDRTSQAHASRRAAL